MKYVANTRMPHFRGVYMRDKLPLKSKPIECGIVNLDDYKGAGTHWVAYVINNNNCEYFDSYGDLKPPKELVKYFGKRNIYYNYNKYQSYGSVNCGHLCLQFLQNFWNKLGIN